MRRIAVRSLPARGLEPWPVGLPAVMVLGFLTFVCSVVLLLTVRFDLDGDTQQPVFVFVFDRVTWTVTLVLFAALFVADAWEGWTRRHRSLARGLLSGLGLGLTALLWVLLLPWFAAGERQGSSQQVLAILDRAQQEVDRAQGGATAPALGVALRMPDGRPLCVSAGGIPEPEPDGRDEWVRWLRADDRVRCGEIGRSFLWAVAMQAESEGRLDWDAPVSDFLGEEPWFDRIPNARRAPRVRDLLEQRSGIPNYHDQPEFQRALAREPEREWEPEQLLAFVLDHAPRFAPGEDRASSDAADVLTALLLERVLEADWEELVDRRIREPGGFEALGVLEDPFDLRDLSGHGLDGMLMDGFHRGSEPIGSTHDPEFRTLRVHPSVEWGGGASIGTPSELARWAQTFFQGPGAKSPWAAARSSPDGPVSLLEGRSHGYRAVMAYFPRAEIAVAVGLNTDDPSALAEPATELALRLGALAIEELERR